MPTPTLNEIREAATRISPYIRYTPTLTSDTFNKIANANLFFKCENFQKTGSFKFRGACNAVFSLPEDKLKYGVATHSSGNHGAALALAAKLRGIPAYIVMPNNSPEVKKQAVSHYGANITFCEPTAASREATLEEVLEKTEATKIHPYENEAVICGQGTAALEFLIDENLDFDILVTPIGGGGLIAGTAIAAKSLASRVKIIGAEPETMNDAALSFQAKKITPVTPKPSLCDGLSPTVGNITFPLILKYVDHIFTASEQSILDATKYFWERMKIIVEPSSAISLAVILEHPQIFKDKKIGVIVSGGNVDIKKIADLF